MSMPPGNYWFAWEAPTGLVHIAELVSEGYLSAYCQTTSHKPTIDQCFAVVYAPALTCLWCAAWWERVDS